MRLGRRRGITLLLIAAAASVGGCGSGSADVAEAPAGCLESWNADDTAERFGRHIYNSHDTRRTQVGNIEAVSPNPTSRAVPVG